MAKEVVASEAVVVAVSVEDGGAGVVPGLVGEEGLEGEPGDAAGFTAEEDGGGAVAAAAAVVVIDDPGAVATGLAM